MTDQIYDWQSGCKKWSQRGAHLLKSAQWTDCTFLVGDDLERVEAHRLILAMASPVFEAMFYGGMPETGNSITVTDIDTDIFKSMLKYIYEDGIEIESIQDACGLAYAGTKYMLPYLTETCIDYVKSNVDYENAGQVYDFAADHNNPELMDKCLKIICNNTSMIIKKNLLGNMRLETLELIFEQEYLNIENELDLFRAAESYMDDILIESESSSTEFSIISAIKKIRFLTLTPEEFCDLPARSSLLTDADKLTILTKLISPEADIPMPDEFTLSTVHRNPLLYCKRIFANESWWENTGIDLHYIVNIKVDKNIIIHGLQIPTQRGNLGEMYEEYVAVSIGPTEDFKKIAECSLYVNTHYNGILNVYFNTPCCIEAEKEYDIQLQFHKSGTYLTGIGSAKVKMAGVNFEFFGSLQRGKSLTRSIIFKLDKK